MNFIGELNITSFLFLRTIIIFFNEKLKNVIESYIQNCIFTILYSGIQFFENIWNSTFTLAVRLMLSYHIFVLFTILRGLQKVYLTCRHEATTCASLQDM